MKGKGEVTCYLCDKKKANLLKATIENIIRILKNCLPFSPTFSILGRGDAPGEDGKKIMKLQPLFSRNRILNFQKITSMLQFQKASRRQNIQSIQKDVAQIFTKINDMAKGTGNEPENTQRTVRKKPSISSLRSMSVKRLTYASDTSAKQMSKKFSNESNDLLAAKNVSLVREKVATTTNALTNDRLDSEETNEDITSKDMVMDLRNNLLNPNSIFLTFPKSQKDILANFHEERLQGREIFLAKLLLWVFFWYYLLQSLVQIKRKVQSEFSAETILRIIALVFLMIYISTTQKILRRKFYIQVFLYSILWSYFLFIYLFRSFDTRSVRDLMTYYGDAIQNINDFEIGILFMFASLTRYFF